MKDQYFGAHEFQVRDEVIKISSERSFGLTVAFFFGLLAALSLYHGTGRWQYWGPLAALFGVLACVAPSVLAPLNRLWARFGLLMQAVVSPVIMGVLFYVCVTPIGILMRLTGKDPMCRKLERGAESYWIAREPPGPAPESFRNQF